MAGVLGGDEDIGSSLLSGALSYGMNQILPGSGFVTAIGLKAIGFGGGGGIGGFGGKGHHTVHLQGSKINKRGLAVRNIPDVVSRNRYIGAATNPAIKDIHNIFFPMVKDMKKAGMDVKGIGAHYDNINRNFGSPAGLMSKIQQMIDYTKLQQTRFEEFEAAKVAASEESKEKKAPAGKKRRVAASRSVFTDPLGIASNNLS